MAERGTGGEVNEKARFHWKRARDRVARAGYLIELIPCRQSQRHNRVRSPKSAPTSFDRGDNSRVRCGARSWGGSSPAALCVATSRAGGGTGYAVVAIT